MARKRNGDSAKKRACTRGCLELFSKDPDLPIKFDPKLNEFNIEYVGADGSKGRLRIYHCPICGGAAPKSLRSSLFSKISASELRRLESLTAGIRTINDAIERFGKPDEDNPLGTGVQIPENGAQPPTFQNFRTITFEKLSKVADVEIVDRLKESVQIVFVGKYVGPKNESGT